MCEENIQGAESHDINSIPKDIDRNDFLEPYISNVKLKFDPPATSLSDRIRDLEARVKALELPTSPDQDGTHA